jgi:F0F1-type ATP synthase assembly protein I
MWRIAARYSAVGLEMGIAVLIGYFGGYWLDRHFGTAPWMMYAGLGLGLGASTKAIVDAVKRARKDGLV